MVKMVDITIPSTSNTFIVTDLAFNDGRRAEICLDIKNVHKYRTEHEAFLITTSAAGREFECYIKQDKITKRWHIYDITTKLPMKEEKERST